MGDNPDLRKYVSIIFGDESIYEISKLYLNKFCNGRTHACTLARTHKPKAICPLNFSKVGDIKLKELIEQTFNRDGALYLAYNDKNAFFLLPNNLNDISCCHVRKYVILFIIFRTIYL